MKRITLISLFVVMAVLIIAVFPAAAQLGDTDISSFTVQNVSGGDATVSVTFYAEDGTAYTPTDLGAGITNPFTLTDGSSQQVFVPNIPDAQLPSGRYSVVVSADAQVVAQAGVAGTGTTRFSGSYVGFSEGATTTYLPAAVYNYFGWYSMISVQNVGSAPTGVTVTITCADGSTGTLSTTSDIPVMSSVTWALKDIVPTGFSTSDVCEGSAVVTSTGEPVVAVNNQNKPLQGATNTFESATSGGDVLYVPNLMNGFSNWISALTIQKIDSGNTTVTVQYDDGDPDDICNLTDAVPACKLIMPNEHTQTGRFAATISSTGGVNLLAIVGSTKQDTGWSGATSAVVSGSETVAIPNVSKDYFGWRSAINCQNVGGTATALNVSYSGYEASAYNTPSLASGESFQILVFNEPFITAPWQGGATVTANAAGAEIACTVGNSNATGAIAGDWTSQYNAYNR